MSELITLCRDLVNFETYDSHVRGALEYFQGYMEKLGFKTEIVEFFNAKGQKVANLQASVGAGEPHFLFCGHMDVVPAGDVGAWNEEPFSGTVKDNIFYGRGIADMKGGIACFADACREYLQKNELKGKISFIISGDEEEPLVNGTEKLLQKMAAEGEKFDFALVGEPSNPEKIGEEIKVGRRGDVVLRITSQGKQGHVAYPHLVINPVHNLVNLLAEMQNTPLDNGNEFFGPSTLQVTTFDVGNPASNVVPAQAYAQIDIRFNSEHTAREIIAWAQNIINRTSGDFVMETEIVGESFLSPINDSIKVLGEIIKQHTGMEAAHSTAGGTSDARFVKNYCPVVEFGLTNGSIHKVNESESVANIELLQKIYQDFLVAFFA